MFALTELADFRELGDVEQAFSGPRVEYAINFVRDEIGGFLNGDPFSHAAR